MIRLARARDAALIPAKYRDPKRALHEAALLALRAADDPPDSKHWKASKAQLKAETHGKCAYCEAPTDTVAHGDVEHFRPKSVYWWLAYCWDNWLFACQICNQTYKGDQFPIAGVRVRSPSKRTKAGKLAPDPIANASALAALRGALRREKADLIDPYDEDPERLLSWHADERREVVEVIARPRSRGRRRIEATTTLVGLNREELGRERWRVFRLLRTFVRVREDERLEATTREQVSVEIARMLDADAPFAAMCRYFVREVWGRGGEV